MAELFQKVVDSGKKYGVHTGMHIANLEKLKEWMEKGMHIIAYNTDLGFLKSSASAGLSDLREYVSAL
jgi:hypothetical protein